MLRFQITNDFTGDSAEKAIKSFLDWLQAEIRSTRKSFSHGSSSANNIASVLKELKWIILLFDAKFPCMSLNEIICELIACLTDALDYRNFPEIIFISCR